MVLVTTITGEVIEIQGISVSYVQTCRYKGDHTFTSEDPRKLFCSESHRVMFYKKNLPVTPSVSTSFTISGRY